MTLLRIQLRPWSPDRGAAVWATAAFAMAFGGLYLWRTLAATVQYHGTVIARDQWRIYSEYLQTDLLNAVLLSQNGHRPIIPGLLFMLDLYGFQASNAFLILFGLACNLLLTAILCWVIAAEHVLPPALRWLIGAWMVVLMFWMGNANHLGWGNNAAKTYLLILTFALAVMAQARALRADPSSRAAAGWTALMLSAAAVSTVCFAPGMAVWPALILIAWTERAPRGSLLLVLTGLAVCLVLYLTLPGSARVRIQLSSVAPLDLFAFFGNFPRWAVYSSGFQMARNIPGTIYGLIGLAGAMASLVIAARAALRRERVGLTVRLCHAFVLLGWVVVVELLLARAFRHDQGGWAFAPRYAIWSMVFWMGLIPLMWIEARQHGTRVWGRAAGALVVLGLIAAPLLLLPSQLRGESYLARWSSRSLQPWVSLLVDRPDSKLIRERLWSKDINVVYGLTQALRARRLNLFQPGWHLGLGRPLGDVVRIDNSAVCTGRVLEKEGYVTGGREAALRLRLVARAHGTAEAAPYLLIADGDSIVRGLALPATGEPRAAAKFRPDPAFVYYGYSQLTGDDYLLHVYIVRSDGRACLMGNIEPQT